ncbi:MAG: heme ABC exporter ATP-binding protein CcmA [Proteobacteria bacterium]|nr:heme ABC exporter ATP-binding protein CcmA [Pseudomonadota bacterium]
MNEFGGEDLTCIRGERGVFAGLSFALAPGGALLLTGPNGSGKSSLLRLMAGLARPARGEIRWRGRPIAEDAEAHRARLAYVGHLDAVKPALTVSENAAFWAALAADGAGRAALAARVEAALARFRLAHLAGLPARLLSAGQRRRLGLARALCARAVLWLLDEPAVSLDERAVGDLAEAIAGHRAAGGLVVVSSHTALALPGARRLDLAAHPFAPGGPA